VLSVESLAYRRGGKEILRGVSLHVGEGEFVALIGPNGAGKSTLLKHAAGVLPPPRGAVFLGGEDRALLDPREAARRVAYVPQARDPEIPYNGREIAEQARYPYLSTWRPARREDRRRAEEALAEVGALAYADRPFGTLSGGEQQAVLVAAALAQDARLLLVDEPTTFLDPAAREEVFRILGRARRERGLALLVVTHELNRALLSADRITALKEGRVVREGAPDEIARAGVLREIYGEEFLLATHPETGGPVVLPRRERG